MKELTIDSIYAYKWVFVFLLIASTVILFPFFLFVADNPKEALTSYNFYRFMGIYAVMALIHELIHGVFFAIYSKSGFKSVSYGVSWKLCACYATCREPITAYQYGIVLLMPTLILGLLSVALGYLLNDFTLLLVSSLLIGGGSGDLLSYRMSRKVDKNSLVLDHPNKVGFYYDIEQS